MYIETKDLTHLSKENLYSCRPGDDIGNAVMPRSTKVESAQERPHEEERKTKKKHDSPRVV